MKWRSQQWQIFQLSVKNWPAPWVRCLESLGEQPPPGSQTFEEDFYLNLKFKFFNYHYPSMLTWELFISGSAPAPKFKLWTKVKENVQFKSYLQILDSAKFLSCWYFWHSPVHHWIRVYLWRGKELKFWQRERENLHHFHRLSFKKTDRKRNFVVHYLPSGLPPTHLTHVPSAVIFLDAVHVQIPSIQIRSWCEFVNFVTFRDIFIEFGKILFTWIPTICSPRALKERSWGSWWSRCCGSSRWSVCPPAPKPPGQKNYIRINDQVLRSRIRY